MKGLQDEHDVQIHGNGTAWRNSHMTIEWLRFFFSNRSRASEPILLLLDSFSGHWTSDVREFAASRNVFLKAVPPKLTWRC